MHLNHMSAVDVLDDQIIISKHEPGKYGPRDEPHEAQSLLLLPELPESPVHSSACLNSPAMIPLLRLYDEVEVPPVTPQPSLPHPHGIIQSLQTNAAAANDDVSDMQDLPEAILPLQPSQLPVCTSPNDPPSTSERAAEQELSQADTLANLESFQREIAERWVLNMTIHFPDESGKEKFYITFAERPDLWRRVTVSVIYDDAPADSLEQELRELHNQLDKSHCIYDALRESLPTISFFATVTNLKLLTDPVDGQLHVHVREDTNEIIQFPPIASVAQLRCRRYREQDLTFHSHISGFVYKVKSGDDIFVKKEIPGRYSVDEFLYELNALNALRKSSNVIQLRGVVTDNEGAIVKGLLIHYAPNGSLADILYDLDPVDLILERREKWACQITRGLRDIHEAGFVQGDLTLSNIVIDEKDDARIIDINRRGCPLGWEPPELMPLIQSGVKVAMYISAKTDLYQLGIVLAGLAKHDDNPDQYDVGDLSYFKVSESYQNVVRICLSQRPQDRRQAFQLLEMFPRPVTNPWQVRTEEHSMYEAEIGHSDPSSTITREDIRQAIDSRTPSIHRHASSEPWSIAGSRGRTRYRGQYRLPVRSQHTATSETSLSSLSSKHYNDEELDKDAAEASLSPPTHAKHQAPNPEISAFFTTLQSRDSGFDETFEMLSKDDEDQDATPPALTDSRARPEAHESNNSEQSIPDCTSVQRA